MSDLLLVKKSELADAITDAVKPLKARINFLEEMGAECVNDWQKIEHLRAEIQRANEYALRLVLTLAARFPAVEGFHALPDLDGRLSQIDNMTCRLPLGFGNSGEANGV
ncbi:MAG TPA: hypothetical protein VN879_16085 [Candidatus Acidoferrales bacterium]|nr:hypothetical protein [Candidatus Acidoferrales bacterium]